MKWFKKNLSDDYVDLSIGRTYFNVISNGVVNQVTNSSMVNGEIHPGLFFTLFEYMIVNLSKKKIDNLSVVDGKKLRKKLVEILNRYGITMPTMPSDNVDLFKPHERNWFNNTASVMSAGRMK